MFCSCNLNYDHRECLQHLTSSISLCSKQLRLHFLQFTCSHLPDVPGLSDNQFAECRASHGVTTQYLVHLSFLLQGQHDIM